MVAASKDQTSVVPGAERNSVAITCGTVVLTESEPGSVRSTLDSCSPNLEDGARAKFPSLTTATGGRVFQHALDIGIPFSQSLIYRHASRIRQGISQYRRKKTMTDAEATMSEEARWRRLAWTDQRTPALAIVARGDQIRQTGPGAWSVASQSRPGTFHHVAQVGPKWTCDCLFFTATSMTCIHVLSIRFMEGFRESAPLAISEPLACEACGSAEVVSNGVRHNKSGDLQTYLCRSCGRRFVDRGGFKHRRSEPETVALALDLYFRGLSLQKVADHFGQTRGLKVGKTTIYRWVRGFGALAAEWMDKQGARVGDRWHVDETVVNIGGDNRYLWNVLDGETRFALATHVSRLRDLPNTRAPLHKAKQATGDRPRDVLTDGMMTYPEAVRKELGRPATPFDDPKFVRHGRFNPHRRVPSIRAKESNNRIERFHGTEKERTKVMRAFKTKDGASDLMEGFRAHYNLVKTHETLGTTPGEAAGIPTGDGFRWLTILGRATEAIPRKGTVEVGANKSLE